jgi:hypothetical protein
MTSNKSAAARTLTLPTVDPAPQPARMTPIVTCDGGEAHRACFRYAEQSNAETHYVTDGGPICGKPGGRMTLDSPGKVCLDCVSVASTRRLLVR